MSTKTIVDVFEHRINRSGSKPAAHFPAGPSWESVTWNQWWEQSERISAGLIDLGILPGDRVAILSNTRFEWALSDIGVLMSGAVSVPLFPSNLPDVLAYIIADAKPKVVIVEDPSQLSKLLSIRGQIKGVKHVVLLESIAAYGRPDWNGRLETRLDDLDLPKGWVLSFDALVDRGRRLISTDHRATVDRRGAIEPEWLATVVYTSGTGDHPKGVQLTHQNLVSEIEGLTTLGLLDQDDTQLLFLPLAHIFARILYLTAIGYGIDTAFLGDVSRLSGALDAVSPTFFAGVPHVFEKIRNRLVFDAQRFGGVRGAVFDAAYLEGVQATNRNGGLFQRLKLKVYDELVYSRVRDRFGGSIRLLISGGAPLPRELAEFYFALGIPILEGYGLTETCGVAAVNLLDEYRIGTVGRPVPGVEVTIDEDGEVLVRGKTIMKGYHGDRKATQEALDGEGWFHTGDLGEYDRDGYLRITGRKKDIIVTTSGKNIAPQRIEAMLAASPFVEHALVFGDNRPFIVALLTLSEENVRNWAEQTGTSLENPMAETPALRRLIQAQIDHVNAEVAAFSTVKRFGIVSGGLTFESHELTATNKVRRSVVAEHHADVIDGLYREI